MNAFALAALSLAVVLTLAVFGAGGDGDDTGGMVLV